MLINTFLHRLYMLDTTKWNYYYNLEGTLQVRANLVYTPRVSQDQKVFCMDFNRDEQYHIYPDENSNWTSDLLTDRFNKELKYHSIAKNVMPTLNIIDVDYANRRIFLEWFGNDFYMQGLEHNGYDNVLPDWKEQWIDRIITMRNNNFCKISLHPNSWVAKDNLLYPINWFFCLDKTDKPSSVRDYLIQISSGRQEKLSGIDLDRQFTPEELQFIAFESFRSNYPSELIDEVKARYVVR